MGVVVGAKARQMFYLRVVGEAVGADRVIDADVHDFADDVVARARSFAVREHGVQAALELHRGFGDARRCDNAARCARETCDIKFVDIGRILERRCIDPVCHRARHDVDDVFARFTNVLQRVLGVTVSVIHRAEHDRRRVAPARREEREGREVADARCRERRHERDRPRCNDAREQPRPLGNRERPKIELRHCCGYDVGGMKPPPIASIQLV